MCAMLQYCMPRLLTDCTACAVCTTLTPSTALTPTPSSTVQASTLKIRPAFQMTVLQEVVTWFDQPQLLVEMFVNFDMDRKFVSHWNVFSHLVGGVLECV